MVATLRVHSPESAGHRICLDASAAVHGRAGIGRYTQELAAALTAVEPGYQYTLFYNRAREGAARPPLDRLAAFTTPLADKPWRLSVLLAHLLRRPQDRLFPGIDLFHATDHLLPRLSRVPSVFTLYDLTVRLYPAAHTSLNRWYLTLMMPRFLRSAGRVITISECTRRDATRLYGLDESRVRVVHAGVSSAFRPADAMAVAAARGKYDLPERFILYVGTIEPRKNLTTLLEAFRVLRNEYPQLTLVVVGRRGWRSEGFYRRLHELALEPMVRFLGYVPEPDLAAVYSAADLFAFPSLYEGFGLPVLEAMACGTPVVCSDAASLPEVAGEAALLVPPGASGALAAAMGRLLADSRLQTEMRGRGLARVRGFTWDRAAHRTAAVYEELLREAQPPFTQARGGSS